MQIRLFISLLLIVFSCSFNGQTTVSQPADFSTTDQSMFGPSGNFDLNFEIPIFDVPWNNSFGPSGGIADPGFGLGQYGFEFSGGTYGNFGLTFYSRNWNNGEIDVDYPIHVNYTYPSDYTFEKGETITINTNYTVDSDAELITRFPETGNIGMEFEFNMRFWLTPTICFYSCVTPGFDTGDMGFVLTLFDVSANEATYACPDPANGFQCTEPLLPVAMPDNDYGLDGEFDLPNVQTTSSIGTGTDKCLYATGRDPYTWVSLEIFQFIGGLNIPYVSAVLGNLSGGDCYLGGQVCWEYVLFSASFVVTNYNVQDFKFCPDVYTTLSFPVPVEYTVTDPTSGNSIVSGPGQSDNIRFKVGNDLNFTYPCNYEFMEIEPEHEINNQGDNFTNNTYDEIQFDFTMEALSASITIEGFSVEGVWVPGFCSFGHPCNCSWFLDCSWCCDLYIPGFWLPPSISLGPWSFGIGPLYENTIPLGTLPGIPWFNDSWNLPGFDKEDGTPFKLRPNEYLATTVGSSDINCFGGNDGSLTVQVTNGRPPYNYQWSDGTTTVSNATPESNTSFVAGNQYALVTNVFGCQAFADAILYEPTEPLRVLDESILNADCNGNNTGRIDLEMTGGTPTYSYVWTPNVSSTNQANNLTAGNYNLDVTDAKGCLFNTSFNVEEPKALTAYVDFTDVDCNGGSNGTAKVFASGGSYPYTYLWSDGSTNQTVPDFVAGNHSVTITDAKLCAFDVNFTIAEPLQAIALSSVVTNVSCFDGSDGEIDMTVSGGTGPYTYSWTNSYPIQMAYITEDVVAVTADTYTAKIIDAQGCVAELASTVSQPVEPLSSTISVIDVNCQGGSDGSIGLTVSGGTAGYSYVWSDGSTSEDLNLITSNNYIVTITDAMNCILIDSGFVAEPSAPLTVTMVSKDVSCHGGNDGEIDLDVTGGTEPYLYIWSNSAASQDIEDLTALTYNIVVTDANNCTVNDARLIDEPAAPLAITGTQTDVTCFGGNDGLINATVSGGTSLYDLSWNTGNLVVLADTTNSPMNLYSGTYTLTAIDANGCIESEDFVVNEPNNPLLTVLASNEVLCYNGTNANINLTVSGGSVPYSYLWNTGAISEDLSGVGVGNYIVEVTDDNSCVSKDSIIVIGPDDAVVATTESLNVRCNGGSNGYAEVTALGGVYPYTYLWSNGVANPINNNLEADNYSVIVTDANGCTANSGVTITEPDDAVEISYVMDSVSCKGYADGKITIDATQGVKPYEVFFGDSTFSQLNTANRYEAYGLVRGTYHVRVVDANGCDANITIEVLEPDTITYEISTIPVTCYGGSDGVAYLTVQGGTPGYQYFWSNATFNQDLTNVAAGNYSVAISDANNCIVETETTITQPTEIITEANVYATSCIDSEDGSIEVFVRGGVGGYDYFWSNREVTSDIYGLAGGEYTIQIIDENNCVKMDTFFVNVTEIECVTPPTAFTPDGDGYNDTWVLDKLELYPKAIVQIFNKWGHLLYETNGLYIPWDGAYKGKILPAATYYYIVDLGNGTPAYTGVVTIVKRRN